MKLILGDCLDKLKELDNNSIDSIVTDPPYGLSAAKNSGKSSKGGFMGKHWDYDVPSKEIWEECMRVLKPGGHLLAFAGSRTYHRMAVRIEDAGFEIRDMISWIYGSGFPKSMDISKQIDKRAGVEREVIGTTKGKGGENLNKLSREGKGDSDNAKGMGAYGLGAKQITIDIPLTAPTTDEAKKWEGWGTALKPAHEPIVIARKPLSENTVADNVIEWGTGGINIDESRIVLDEKLDKSQLRTINRSQKTENTGWGMNSNSGDTVQVIRTEGRFPANVIFDEEAGKMLDEQSGELKSGFMKAGTPRKMSESDVNTYGHYDSDTTYNDTYGDSGGASRFFYCPKVSKKERNEGLEHLEGKRVGTLNANSADLSNYGGSSLGAASLKGENKLPEPKQNHHPTVKPTDLMLYLIRLVTPKGGVTLDPFMGSGSTGKAAVRGGFDFIGIEREEEYFQIAEGRINYEINKPTKTTKSKVEVSKEVEEKVNQFFG
jgi:DNA modification methylase